MTSNSIRTQNLGYPRIGLQRELKKRVEAYWKSEISAAELEQSSAELRRKHWEIQRDAGIDLIPCNDFSLYDQILDMTCLLGNIPSRFHWHGEPVDLDLYFRMARGKEGAGTAEQGCCASGAELACEMTKWFDTNYHYLVPEFDDASQFQISSSKVFDEFIETTELGLNAKPVLIGPLTYLVLGKEVNSTGEFDRFELADALIAVYVDVLKKLHRLGAKMVQIDEPAVVLDLDERHREILQKAYVEFARQVPGLEIQVAAYFGELRENLSPFLDLPVAGLHLDAVRGRSEIESAISRLKGKNKFLSLGVVEGRNVWKTNLKAALKLLRHAADELGENNLLVAPSCSLLHVPVSLAQETGLDPEIANWLAFADEKLAEVETLRVVLETGDRSDAAFVDNEIAIQSRRRSGKVSAPSVQARLAALRDDMFERDSPFTIRKELQRSQLQLPAFPTTTIGSFPQTAEVRQARAKFRHGEWTKHQYETFLRLRTADCIQMQENIGLDVLVHGEFERNDMVEYFGEQLEGFTFTRFAWVQSYGSRCVKPPIIFGDVSRPRAMTVDWANFAQSCTSKPMKGMLTGPVTILQWSFVRDDQPRRDTTMQIALAIRDEVTDLEAAGLPIIQIDEAAIREGLPLRRSDWPAYLDWAVKAFRLSSTGVADETQIHTHMCYSEFNDMLDAIANLDADVITIENARSNLELLEAFAHFSYPNEIGPGVYDIHSPRVPTTGEIVTLLRQAGSVIQKENLWVNPDCGLKTRSWEDVKPALQRMVAAAQVCRRELPATV
ncbi:MAG: 5-methyltetrahydropteroyltriglutamate--homocysteine S-methyltransferase [Verrucomicrobiales bacterium]|nr:5-methyltetrahydropteroyltriglutamate--homocysteine S-methyltransferase [Verrucomicrobiales bacterium]